MMTKSEMIKNFQENANQKAINAQYNGNHFWYPDVSEFLRAASWAWNLVSEDKITEKDIKKILDKARKA